MNFSYFRKSTRSYEETVNHLNKALETQQWTKIGTAELSDQNGQLTLIYKQDLLDALFEVDHRLLSLMPLSVSVINKAGETLVGTGQTQLLKALAVGPEMSKIAETAEIALKKLVHEAANVAEPKLEQVKLYSSMSCPYCKMEQKWLESHNIDHKVVYVDLQPDEADSLVKRTGQLGVPVTEIIYEESDPEFVIGFDKDRLSEMLKLKTETPLIIT